MTTEMTRYSIVETFHSLQGEGAWSGVNAFFIRLGGCDVHCSWCDQKETWNAHRYPSKPIHELLKEVNQASPQIVIITGGEPLLHNLQPLTTVLHQHNHSVHLETSGAHPFSGEFDWVTFSPKPYKTPHESVYDQVSELKVVIHHEDDFIWAENQAKKVQNHVLKYLQPEWNNPQSASLIFNYILTHPQWRMSLQTHKFLGVR